MEDKNKVTIGIETRGFEEAAEDIELMADAIAELPAVVNVKAKDCKIDIRTTNIVLPREEGGDAEYMTAPGGVIPKPEESEKESEVVWPVNKLEEELMKDMLRNVKTMCKSHTEYCNDCFLRDENGVCFVNNRFPENWRI